MVLESDELERLIVEDMRKVYSQTVIDHAMNPRNVGAMADADGIGMVTGPCGDTMEIWLKVAENTVSEASFLTDGCGTTIAAGSMVTTLAKGKAVSWALVICQEDVLNALEGLPEESAHCALLAANTLRQALKNWLDSRTRAEKGAHAGP